MELHFIRRNKAETSVVTDVGARVGPLVLLETRAVTQARLAYGFSFFFFFFLPRRGKHSRETSRAVKHTAEDRSPCGPPHRVDTHRGPRQAEVILLSFAFLQFQT